MDDLISRQAAIEEIARWIGYIDEDMVLRIQTGLKKVPSAQPEIIRCKDCKHYVIHTLFGRSQGWCERLCDEFDRALARGTEPDDFCSRAERRTEDE